MIQNWQSLIANLAVVVLFISAWTQGHALLENRAKHWRNLSFGVVTGLGCGASMLLALQVDQGVLFDLRSSLLAVSGFFGGPLAAAAAVVVASVCRISLGGPGTYAGIVGIMLSAIAGIAVSKLTRGRVQAAVSLVILATTVFVLSIALRVVFQATAGIGGFQLLLPVAVMNGLATAISTFFIMRSRVVARETELFRAAFAEAPDFQFVKSLQGAFTAVNAQVARHNGYATPAEMLGKTDFDLVPADRAEALMAAEHKVLAGGEPLIDLQEMVSDAFGEERWFSTSKVALHNADGDVIGLGGVTRDVTRSRRLREEAVQGRDQLNYVLSEVTEGIAMFDRQGTLVYRNAQYAALFPLTKETRRSGQHIRDILEAVVETGEQKQVPPGEGAQWVDKIAESLSVGGEEEIELFDGRWLLLRTRPTADGSALVVVSDITAAKESEAAVAAMTDQLKQLATTDGLTGLANRRAFDLALEGELARSRRSHDPLAILMIDVDRFKTYNDIYGHQAGDAALQAVGRCLKSAVRRPGDMAARYGGEEFIAILPNTSTDGALFIADEFRENLHALHMEHTGGDSGMLTASVGISAFTEIGPEHTAAELVRRADAALYASKDAGRDRALVWTPAHDVLQATKVHA